MDLITSLLPYWDQAHVHANLIITLNLAGALALGLLLGYERSYHGRAAGMRTYGMVCMVSAGIVLVSGYPDLWYGTQFVNSGYHADPTRSIQGIVTGIGFLCTGVIVKEGFSISGLTTAASIWMVAAVGILVGVGLFLAAIFMAFGSIFCMTLVTRLEARLPSRPAVAVMLRFRKDFAPATQIINDSVGKRGYRLAVGSISISHTGGRSQWHFVVQAIDRSLGATLPDLSNELQNLDGVEDFTISHARN